MLVSLDTLYFLIVLGLDCEEWSSSGGVFLAKEAGSFGCLDSEWYLTTSFWAISFRWSQLLGVFSLSEVPFLCLLDSG